jgi:hypothetical protein
MSFMHSILEDDQFWKVLKFMTSLETPMSTKELLIKFEISENYLNKMINFLNDLQYPIRLEQQTHSVILIPPTVAEVPEFKLTFGLFDWLVFQAHFPMLECPDKKFHHHEFQNLLKFYENKFTHTDLYRSLEILHSIVPGSTAPSLSLIDNIRPDHQLQQLTTTDIIEKAISEVKQIKIKLANHKAYHEYVPYKLIHLEGELSLFGEDLHDQCLSQIPLSEICECEFIDSIVEHKYSNKEINDFIDSLRSMNENQVRLILKIYADKVFDFSPEHLHMGNPCVVVNGEGDRIWAAYVEPCEALYEWLFINAQAIDIIEPTQIKKQYLAYCEEQLKKIAV